MSTARVMLRVLLFALVSTTPAATQIVPLVDVTAAGRKVVSAALGVGMPMAPTAANPGAASHFIGNEAHPTVVAMATRLAPRAQDRQQLREGFEQALAAVAEQAARLDVADDMAAGLTFLVATRHFFQRQAELPDQAVQKVAWQLQAALDTGTVRKLADADKQAVHEWAVCTTVFLRAMAEAAQGPDGAEQRKAILALTDGVLAGLFGVAAERIRTSDAGLAIEPARRALIGSRIDAGAPESRKVGRFPAPAGWSDAEVDGMRTLTRQVQEFGLTQTYRLLVLQPRDRGGALRSRYHALWDELLGPSFTREQPFLPMLRRLGNGCVCAYDNGQVRRKEDGRSIYMGLFVLDDGVRHYPVVAVYDGFRDDLERDFTAMFEGFTPRVDKSQVPLFDPAWLAGKWRAGAASYADLVDVAGNYRGDASILWGETLDLRADGTYVQDFAAVSGVRRIRQHTEGTWNLVDDLITFTPTKGDEVARVWRRRLCGLTQIDAGKGRVLMLSRDSLVPIPMPWSSSKPYAGELYRLER